MRKTSLDGGDSTSIKSGAENEFKKSGILKSKRNSVKRKVQSLSHDHDDGTIEPLLQKENEKTETGNDGAKHFSSKIKTDSTSNKGNDTEKLLADKNVEKSTISDIPGIAAASHFDAVNSMASTHNYMHSNVFSSNGGTKDPAKSQILVEIDANKQSVYNPSPLIFTTAKIHTDGNAKHIDLVNVTPVPIVLTIEENITKSECIVESNGSITNKIDNNLSKAYAKAGANSLVNTGTIVGESSVNKSNSSQSQVTPNRKTLLADSIPEPEQSGTRCNENIVDINKNIETVNINSINFKSNVLAGNEKNVRNLSEVIPASSQNLTLHTCVSSGTSNTCTTGFSSFVPFTCSYNVSVAPKTMELPTTACSASVTETKNAALTFKTKNPISLVKTSQPTFVSSSSRFAQIPTITRIQSNSAAKDLTTPKSTAVSKVNSICLSKSIPSTKTVTNSSSFIKDSKPFTKQISSASAAPSQVKNQPTTVSNTTTATSVHQSSKASSYSTNTKTSVGQVPNSIPMNSTVASSIAKTTSGLKTKPESTNSTILSNKTTKAIVSKSSAPTTTAAISTGIKTVSKAKAVTTPSASTNKSNVISTGKDSAVGNQLITNKIPATTNKTQPTSTSLSSTTATSVGTVPIKPSVANELTNTKNNERKDGKGKA